MSSSTQLGGRDFFRSTNGDASSLMGCWTPMQSAYSPDSSDAAAVDYVEGSKEQSSFAQVDRLPASGSQVGGFQTQETRLDSQQAGFPNC